MRISLTLGTLERTVQRFPTTNESPAEMAV